MALVYANRVRDTATTTGTGAFTVSGSAPTGFRTLSAVLANTDTFPYLIAHQTLAEYEWGIGTFNGSNQFTRTTVLGGSNGASAVNFSAGPKDVALVFLAEKVLYDGRGTTTLVGPVSITGGVVSSSVSTGDLIISGGLGVSGTVNSGGLVTAGITGTGITGTSLSISGSAALNSGASMLSGSNATALTALSVGRAAAEADFGIAASAGQFAANAGAGDMVIRALNFILTDKATGGNGIKITGGALVAPGVVSVCNGTATPAGGSTSARLLFGTTSGFGIYYGSGAPTVSAAQGSIYIRSDGSSTSTRLYVNTNGSATWTNFTSAA